MKVKLKKIRYKLRNSLGENHLGYELLRPMSRWKNQGVHRSSSICIEGFPRCGNTLAYALYDIYTNGEGHIARHSHLMGQVKKAIRLEVPVLLLMRRPQDAIVSMMMREPNLTANTLAEYYYHYYTRLGFDEKVLLADFKDLFLPFPDLLGRVNERFNTKITYKDHFEGDLKEAEGFVMSLHEENVKRGNLPSEDHALCLSLPSDKKAGKKAMYNEKYEREVSEDTKNRVKELYLSLCEHKVK